MPEGGQAREMFRDALTDLAIIERQALRRHKARDVEAIAPVRPFSAVPYDLAKEAKATTPRHDAAQAAVRSIRNANRKG